MSKNTIKGTFSTNYLLGIFSCLAFIFYLICASPGFGWRDGPEIAVTAVFLDVAHPSGFPTYNLLAKILTWFPFGALAYRVTIFTAMAGGLSIFLLGILLKGLHDQDESKASYPFLFVALFFYAIHQAIFSASVEVEVYSLNAAMIIGLIICAVQWQNGYGLAWLYVGGFLYGISCGNHASLALYLPVLLILTFWTRPPAEPTPNSRTHLIRLGLLSIFFLVGLSVYLLLIVRSQTDRLPVDFGRTNTWSRLWTHLSDAKDKDYHFKGLLNYNELFYFLKLQFKNLASPLFWLGLPFALWGLRYLWKTYQILSVALVILIGVNSLFFYYWIDGTSAFVPTIVCFFLLMGLGLGQFGRFIKKFNILYKTVCVALAVLVIVSGLTKLPSLYRGSDSKSGFMSTEIFWPDLANLPPDSLALHHSQWFSLLALQYLYGARPDVNLLNFPGLVQPQYFGSPVQAKFPRLIFPRRPDGSFLPPDTPNYFSLFLVPNMDAGLPVYLCYGQEIEPIISYLAPEMRFQWMGRLTKDKWAADKSINNGDYLAYLKWLRGYFARLASSNDPPLAPKAPAYMMYFTSPILRMLMEKKYYPESALTVEAMLKYFSRPDGTFMFPMDVSLNLHAFLADNYRRDKKFPQAIDYANKLISLSPYNANSHYMLGLIYDNLNRPEETLAEWRLATELNKYDVSLFYHYYLALAKYKSLDAAIAFLEDRAKQFDEENMANLRDLTLKFRDCLLLPPEEIGDERDIWRLPASDD
jgi:tetratricopeptide (TPR) repeat protein